MVFEFFLYSVFTLTVLLSCSCLSFYICAHFSHFVFYGGFFCLSQYIPNGDEGREWLKKRNSEVVQKRKTEVIGFWLKSFQWLTINLVLFCCPDVRGGLIVFGVVFFFQTSFSKTKQKLVCVSPLCWWIWTIHLLYNSLLLKKILYNHQGFCGFVFQVFITMRNHSQCSSSIITLVQKGKMQFLRI